MDVDDLILRDRLAIERTKLANERTFLAYFRSSIFFLATGVSIISIHFFDSIDHLGYGFIIISPVLMIIGLYRFVSLRNKIGKAIYNTKSKKD